MSTLIFSSKVSLNGKFHTAQLMDDGEVSLLDTDSNMYITHTLNKSQLDNLKRYLTASAKKYGSL